MCAPFLNVESSDLFPESPKSIGIKHFLDFHIYDKLKVILTHSETPGLPSLIEVIHTIS